MMNGKELEVNHKLKLMLWESGWLPANGNTEFGFSDSDYLTVKKDFLSKRYTSTAYAVVPDSLSINGHFGVSWVEVYYEYQDRALSWNDLEDMEHAIRLAEKNLLLCEIPFCDNKSFHGTKQEIRWKINKNNKIRKSLCLDEMEKILWGKRSEEQ